MAQADLDSERLNQETATQKARREIFLLRASLLSLFSQDDAGASDEHVEDARTQHKPSRARALPTYAMLSEIDQITVSLLLVRQNRLTHFELSTAPRSSCLRRSSNYCCGGTESARLLIYSHEGRKRNYIARLKCWRAPRTGFMKSSS